MSKLFLVLLPVVLLVGVAAALFTLNEPIRSVRVEGALTSGEQKAIRDVLTESLDQPLLSLDLELVKQQIRSLSWPREVSVRRVWPATLTINVEKEAPIARWGNDGFLTSDAKIVQLPQEDGSLPGFDCNLSGPKVAMEAFYQLQEVLAEQDLVIEVLKENAWGEWEVSLDNGVTVMLGNERLLDRVRRFTLVYKQALSNRIEKVAHVDARYANGVAVRWQSADAVALVNHPSALKRKVNES